MLNAFCCAGEADHGEEDESGSFVMGGAMGMLSSLSVVVQSTVSDIAGFYVGGGVWQCLSSQSSDDPHFLLARSTPLIDVRCL